MLVQKKLIQLQKILNPGSNKKLQVSQIDIADMLKHMPESVTNVKIGPSSSSVGGVDISEKDLIASGL